MNWTVHNFQKNHLWGYVIKGDEVFKAKSANAEYVTKWEVPDYLLSVSTYPTYVSGSCYIVSSEAVPCLYEASLRVPYFHINDILITGYVADICGMMLASGRQDSFQPFEVCLLSSKYIT